MKDEKRLVRLLIVTPPAPAEYQGQRADFGLQDRAENLAAGEPQPEGLLCFAIEVQAAPHPQSPGVRFSSPYVHGPAGAKFLYLGWRYAGMSRAWIRRQKIPLAAITWDAIDTATSEPPTFAVQIVPITERAATVPAVWSLVTSQRA